MDWPGEWVVNKKGTCVSKSLWEWLLLGERQPGVVDRVCVTVPRSRPSGT